MKVMVKGHLIGRKQALTAMREARKKSNKFAKASAEAGIYPEFQARPSRSGTPPHEYMLYQELGFYHVRAQRFIPGRFWYRKAVYLNMHKWNKQARNYTNAVIMGVAEVDDVMKILAHTIKEDLQLSIIENDVIDWEVGLDSVIAKWES